MQRGYRRQRVRGRYEEVDEEVRASTLPLEEEEHRFAPTACRPKDRRAGGEHQRYDAHEDEEVHVPALLG